MRRYPNLPQLVVLLFGVVVVVDQMGYLVRAFSFSSSASSSALHGAILRQRIQSGRWTGNNKNIYNRQLLFNTQRLYLSTTPTNDEISNPNDDNKKKRIVFLGTPQVAADTLSTIYTDSKSDSSNYDIVGVVTQPPKRRRRKGKVIHSPVGLIAEELGIPILCPEKANDKEFLQTMEEVMCPDLCITAAYGQYLPKRFLQTPTLGTLNIHPSLLPKWRGASPVQRSLEAGENPLGVSVLFTVSKMDAGPIVSQQEHVVDKNDQATTILPLLFQMGTKLLLNEALPGVLDGTITMTNTNSIVEQNEDQVTYAKMISASEAELKVWKETAKQCHDRMRGFSMWPGTFIYIQIGENNEQQQKVKLVETRVLLNEENNNHEFTTTNKNQIEIGPNRKSLRLTCYDGSILEILKLQPVTRKVMDARSFINGLQGRSVYWVKPKEEDEDVSSSSTSQEQLQVATK